MFADPHEFPEFHAKPHEFREFLAEPHEILADPQTFKFKNLLIGKDIGCRENILRACWMTGLHFFSESSSPV
jgi:hypothetical protein